QSDHGGQAQGEGDGHAGRQHQAQAQDDADPGEGGRHDGSPDSFMISTTYCRLSRAKPNTTGVSGIHSGTAATLEVVHPPSSASNRCSPVAAVIRMQNPRPSQAPMRSSQRRVRSPTSIWMKSTPTCPLVIST